MNRLASLIKKSFEYENSVHHLPNHSIERRIDNVFLEIPASNDTLEIPTFALPNFIYLNDESINVDSFVVPLFCEGAVTEYQTLGPSFCQAMTTHLSEVGLVKFATLKDTTKKFYATNGAVFNEQFMPLAVLMWQVSRIPSTNPHRKFMYEFLQPVLRVHPNVVLAKSNSMERFITNKFIPAALSVKCIYMPLGRTGNYVFDSNRKYKCKVVIDDFPFSLHRPSAPSVSTTDRELCDIALNYIDEII